MKKLKNILTLVLSLILLNSCITIEENYFFKKDGSGSMEYVIDMSELEELLKGFDNDDNGMQTEQKNNIDSFAIALESIEHIRKVEVNSDEWIQRISFQFDNIDALNKALLVVTEGGAQWSKKGKVYSRIQGEVDNEKILSGDDENPMGEEFLESMKYFINIKSQKSLKGFKGDSNLEILKNKKSISIKSDFSQLTDNPEVLSFSVKVN